MQNLTIQGQEAPIQALVPILEKCLTDAVGRVLQECLTDTSSTMLGRDAADALVYHLHLGTESDFRALHAKLCGLLGIGGVMIENAVLGEFCRRMGVGRRGENYD